MQHTETYRTTRGPGVVSDVETWVGNMLAVLLAGFAVGAGIIGMLVAFSYISTSINDPFENGVIWMVGGVILAISATIFRREHHIVDDAERRLSRESDGSMNRFNESVSSPKTRR